MTLGSLFAGIGGIELGFKKVGFDCVWAVEIDQKACETYKANHQNIIINKDINDVKLNTLADIDILTAGFPCQAFSVAGYRKGFNDERGNVFFGILRYLEYFKPKIVFLENVKNLKTHDKGKTLKIILKELQKLGYFVKYEILNTAKYGNIPQNRERIYMIGFLDFNIYEEFNFPSEVKLTKSIQKLLDKKASEEFYYVNTKYYEILKENMKNKNTLYQWRRHYVRENKSNLCPTLTANMGTGGHNVPLVIDNRDIRKLTPRECARFQGFPDSFDLPSTLSNASLYKQIGNSVSVSVIEAIARKIKEVL
ncbi:TPA: DNA cytosine methyltransferase [Campylobacter jejuni]|uniref:Cytosine-specific methyltransferase n=1 Tax=Campylobacter jejuni TaxID=197 RepID=A0A431ET25_CAMJU|nr:DNA cytosine methyltransferase [Campylobacter jejuni]EDN5888824.1 DNA cytosine methyltransferase [Campylobacter jejuni]EKS3200843.1 DNA cytosine methyltransferase [Campylobacter jejuni]RTI93777.1 DNA (cytosine-5-)-methyltransferase [Campylobacter jejuni]RTJ13940.1 DNA (cytosine-5-)-methyltransferase [Campylobacter jejuni]RTJ35770.1 DNA (cytosine-5-)-methyltransferase [Campylobacter jejuni]